MRTAPIGALVADPQHRQRWAIADACITHADPRCILAGVAFNEAVAAGIQCGDPAMMFDAARNAVAPGRTMASTLVNLGPDATERWANAEADLLADLDAAACADPWLNDEADVPAIWPVQLRQSAAAQSKRYRLGVTGSRAGFVRVAFRLAFYQLLHAHDWASGLIDTVNRGGDADTNGAIVGALLGARLGAASIPDGWGQLVLTCDSPAPWDRAGLYHPQAMLAVVEHA